MHSIKSQIKNWVEQTFNPKRHIKTSSAIIILAAYALLLHGLIYIPMLFGKSIYSEGYPDTEVYSVWAKNFSEQLLGGEIFPRWLTGLNDGMGQPTFFYYPPLIFYFGTLFYIPKILAVAPFFQIQMLALMGTFLSGVTFFFWIRRYITSYIALISAMIYASFYYNFNICVVLNQSVTGQWPLVWMPLILLATDNLFEKHRFQIPFLAFLYFLLVFTHLISSLIFSGALGIYFLSRLYHTPSCRLIFLKFSAGILLGTGLAALLIWPITELMPFANLHIFKTGSWDYKTQFLLMSWDSSKDLPTDFWVIIGPILCWIFYKESRATGKLEGRLRQITLTMLCINVLTSLMVTLPSKPIWDAIPLLQMVQFPWRFLLLQGLSFSFVFGVFMQCTEKKGEILLAMFFAGALICTVMPDNIIEFGSKSDPRNQLFEQKSQFNPAKQKWREHSFDMLAALNPKTACQDASLPLMLSACVIDIFNRNLSRELLSSNSGGKFNLLQNNSRQMKIAYEVSKPSLLSIKRAYFHGNVAHTDKGVEIPLSYNEDGLITLSVPKGSGIITISLPYFMSEKIGAGISLASLMILLMMVAFEFRKNKPKESNA